ncbi:MAG: helix-turn-helix transcriptional regulator [Elusimicrobia bacterium]|nr:helix-turn-helix transcriptional regulator [Elusimicrobiota bacterium]
MERRTLGQLIRATRLAQDISLREFAKKIGVTPPHVCDIEKDRRNPTDRVLKEIAKVLNLAYEDLQSMNGWIDPDLKDWAQRNPAVGAMLRTMRQFGQDPHELAEKIIKTLRKEQKI